MSDTLIVVSDATPLNILVRTDMVDLLPKLYARVCIPPAVESELSHARTPAPVREWLRSKPPWLEIRKPAAVDRSVARDPGEQEAISLAMELKADFILLDEKNARRSAQRLHLNVVGTVGILELAAARQLLDLNGAFERLRKTDFYLSDAIMHAALERDTIRRKKQEKAPAPEATKETRREVNSPHERQRDIDRER